VGFVDSKKSNEWVLNKAGVTRELLDIAKARKLAYYGHTMRIHGRCLEKEIIQGTMQARKTTHGHDGRHQDVDRTPRGRVIRMTEDRDKWRKYVHGVAKPRIEDG